MIAVGFVLLVGVMLRLLAEIAVRFDWWLLNCLGAYVFALLVWFELACLFVDVCLR